MHLLGYGRAMRKQSVTKHAAIRQTKDDRTASGSERDKAQVSRVSDCKRVKADCFGDGCHGHKF